jgi:hypothetical protein
MTILLTVQTSHTHARTIALAGLAMIVAIEVDMKAGGPSGFYFPFYSHLSIFQLSRLLFTLYPTLISGTIVFQSFTYADPVIRNWQLLSLVYQRQQAILTHMKELEDELRLTSKMGALPSGPVAGAGNAAASSSANSSLPRNLQAKNNASAGGPPAPKAKAGIPSWAFMVGFYILFNYVLK